jgi:hypothetical protein
MDFPPVDVSVVEKRITVDEFDGLNLSAKMREIALSMGTLVENSETITWDQKFGYILRFDVMDFVEVNKAAQEFRQSAQFERSRLKIMIRYAISTADGEKYLSSSGLVETSKD